MNVPYLDLSAAHVEVGTRLSNAYERVLRSGQFILGEELETFELEFAAYCGTPHAIGVGNGLDAITIALRASGIGSGDEVIVPAHTYIATWLAVVASGALIVPVDVEAGRLLLDLDAAGAAITHRTAAIVPVHINGDPIDPGPLARLAERHGLRIIGDAAQAHGAAVNGISVGAMGDAAAFSFYPSKNLGALGDAGAITTVDAELAQRARRIRNYGASAKNVFVELGVNSRLDPLQAAFLREKLAFLDEWNGRRSLVAARYVEALASVPDLLIPSSPAANIRPAWHVFCVRHPRRDEFMEFLAGHGIGTQINYPTPPHLSPPFRDLGYSRSAFPIAEEAAATVFNLPMGPHLSSEQVEHVIAVVLSFR